MTGRSSASLNELAFSGRNKSYGAYYLRRKYPRYLLVSNLIGIVVLLLLTISPFLYYYFEPIALVEGDLMYELEYDGMIAPPEEELSKLLRSLSRPLQEAEQQPVVSDSVTEEKQPPAETPPADDLKREESSSDTVSQPGGSGLGSGTADDTGLATSIDVFPRFPGGDEARLYFLRQHIRYPEQALKGFIQGVVVVTFIIETDGSLSNVDVSKRIGGGCDEEAIRVTKEMPRWDPGKRNGRAVRVMVRMPVVFRIPGKTTG